MEIQQGQKCNLKPTWIHSALSLLRWEWSIHCLHNDKKWTTKKKNSNWLFRMKKKRKSLTWSVVLIHYEHFLGKKIQYLSNWKQICIWKLTFIWWELFTRLQRRTKYTQFPTKPFNSNWMWWQKRLKSCLTL